MQLKSRVTADLCEALDLIPSATNQRDVFI